MHYILRLGPITKNGTYPFQQLFFKRVAWFISFVVHMHNIPLLNKDFLIKISYFYLHRVPKHAVHIFYTYVCFVFFLFFTLD